MPPDPTRPHDQVVLLISPMFVTYMPTADRSPDAIRTPKDFYLARQATAFINENEDTDELTFVIRPQVSANFRARSPAWKAASPTRSSPPGANLPCRENEKFMDIWRLKELLNDESSSRRVGKVMDQFVTAEQTETFLRSIGDSLPSEESQARLVNGDNAYVITRGKAAAVLEERRLVIGAATPDQSRPVHIFQERNGQVLRTFEAQQVEITADPDQEANVFHVHVELNDEIERIGESTTPRSKYPLEFDVPMTEPIAKLPQVRTAKFYLNNPKIFPGQVKLLARERMFISNLVRSELHFRASFASELPHSRHGRLQPWA